MECRKEESMTEKYFPQVGDNELMLTEMPHMNLYDETDLISNITGDYVDKNYLEFIFEDGKYYSATIFGNGDFTHHQAEFEFIH